MNENKNRFVVKDYVNDMQLEKKKSLLEVE